MARIRGDLVVPAGGSKLQGYVSDADTLRVAFTLQLIKEGDWLDCRVSVLPDKSYRGQYEVNEVDYEDHIASIRVFVQEEVDYGYPGLWLLNSEIYGWKAKQ